MRLAILASGNGSNFEAIVKACNNQQIQGEVVVLIVNKQDAYAIERAKQLGIDWMYLSSKQFENHEAFDQKLLSVLKELHIDLIILAGYMRILSPSIIKAYPNKIINIHPSLLPKYKGKNAIEKAYSAKEVQSGVTVHYVNEEVDGGQILLQESLTIDYTQSLEEFENRVHALEHQLFPKAIQMVIEGDNHE